ncbi:Na(+)/H(+) antiporter subunit B [Virgibacillus sp. YIM 98842]|uniref:Na(+)/H(+) antiporter subunit B n=1 Tax=Virgibacillus sp. YIM 98842 TaxID=2663533 RepID=UPI0013DA1DB0|nr:Na(+)/H(+) antiporter subunit B [Virgibacillus sp. YIM 98842]
MKQLKTNNVMLHTLVRIVSFVVLAFSIYLFFAGHNNPGGGFIGGLMTAAAFVLLYLSFNMKTLKKALPFNFDLLIGGGLLIAFLTGVTSMLFGFPFLTQFFEYVQIPFMGEVELTTALPFDLGVYLVVLGAALTIILTIAEDDK